MIGDWYFAAKRSFGGYIVIDVFNETDTPIGGFTIATDVGALASRAIDRILPGSASREKIHDPERRAQVVRVLPSERSPRAAGKMQVLI